MVVAPSSSCFPPPVADAYACAGRREKAIEECELALRLGRGAAVPRLLAAAAYAKIGRTEEARKILQEVESAWKPSNPMSHFIGIVHARLGEKEAAFEWLEKAFQQRESYLVYFKTHPWHNSLHGDPRFDALVKRLGIPD